MVAWDLCLGGSDYPHKKEVREHMRSLEPGDLVAEASGGMRSSDCTKAVGWFEREAEELIEGMEEDWDVGADGPLPMEKVIYITSLDGRKVRWTNCEFLRVPTRHSWWRPEHPKGPTVTEILGC